MALAVQLDTWAQAHEQKGIEKGEALVLQKLPTKRFGTLPAEMLGMISAASAGQIDVWGDRVLDAANLEEVFRP